MTLKRNIRNWPVIAYRPTQRPEIVKSYVHRNWRPLQVGHNEICTTSLATASSQQSLYQVKWKLPSTIKNYWTFILCDNYLCTAGAQSQLEVASDRSRLWFVTDSKWPVISREWVKWLVIRRQQPHGLLLVETKQPQTEIWSVLVRKCKYSKYGYIYCMHDIPRELFYSSTTLFRSTCSRHNGDNHLVIVGHQRPRCLRVRPGIVRDLLFHHSRIDRVCRALLEEKNAHLGHDNSET